MKPFIRLCLAALLLPPSAAHAQDPAALDSLAQAIRTAKADTAKLSAMLALSEQLYAADPDTNKIICRSALTLADRGLKRPGLGAQERSALLRQKATAINNMAASHFIFGDLDSALACFREAQAIHGANQYLPGVADALNNEGLVLGVLGHYGQQREKLFRARAIYADAGNLSASAKILNNIATNYKDLGQLDSALMCLDSCLLIFEGIGDQQGVANTHLNIGQALGERGDAALALEHYLASERTYEALQDDRGLSVCLGNIAHVLNQQGLVKEALAYAHRSLALKGTVGDTIGQAIVRMNIGNMLEDQGEHPLALAAYAKSLAVFSRTGDRSDEAFVHGAIGNALKNMGKLDSALAHYRKSESISRAIGRPADISNAQYKLGHYFEETGQLDSALRYYRACLALDEETQDRESESFALFSIGRVKLLQHRPAEAEQWARRSLALAQELGFPRNIKRAAEVLHQALEEQGRWKEALVMLKLHVRMADSLENKETMKSTLRTQLRYTFQQTRMADSLQRAVELALVESGRQAAAAEASQLALRNKALASGGLLLLFGGGAMYRLDRRRRRTRFQRDAAQLELKALRAQMNPHFLFNALASINDYVLEHEALLASSYLTKFARLMRLVLEHSREPQVSLAKDLEALRLYLDLERLRLNGKFDHQVEVDPAIDPGTTLVPPLTIQPFVENAIWHGLARKQGPGHLHVRVRAQGEQLLITVEDDGVGRGQTTTAQGRTSLGSRITQERLDLLTLRSGGQAKIRYTDLEQGTRVEVELPWVREG